MGTFNFFSSYFVLVWMLLYSTFYILESSNCLHQASRGVKPKIKNKMSKADELMF